jgi:D-3-phosphoglycerate dehydrogenase
MATLNGILAEHKVNVEAQLLGTRREVGYVVTDISATYTDEMLGQIRDLPETIRLRVLS